jgi:hypothetical protein
MSIPNVKRYRIQSPDAKHQATLMAVLPKGADVDAYLAEASKRHDWAAHEEAQKLHTKVRVGQQKQRKR